MRQAITWANIDPVLCRHTSYDVSRQSWWRHQMEAFSALLAICAGNSPVPGEFPTQRPVTRSFDVYFDLRPNKRLSKQSWGWWFETQSRPLWRHRNDDELIQISATHLKTRNVRVLFLQMSCSDLTPCKGTGMVAPGCHAGMPLSDISDSISEINKMINF